MRFGDAEGGRGGEDVVGVGGGEDFDFEDEVGWGGVEEGKEVGVGGGW